MRPGVLVKFVAAYSRGDIRLWEGRIIRIKLDESELGCFEGSISI